MMDFIEKIKEISKTKKGSTILFFGVYVIFFIVIILVIRVGGNKNFMNQEQIHPIQYAILQISILTPKIGFHASIN